MTDATEIDWSALSTEEIVDRAGDLDAKLKIIETHIAAPLKAAKAELLKRCDNMPPEESIGLHGTTKMAELSKVPEKSIVDTAMVYGVLDDKELFFSIANVPVGKVKDYLSPPEWEACIETTREGTRRIKFTDA